MTSSHPPADASAQATAVDEMLVTGTASRYPIICSAAPANALTFVELPKFDLDLYIQNYSAWDCIRKLAPDEPEATRDEAWIDATEKSNKAETQRLESELKGYKNNLIKESIRVPLQDIHSAGHTGNMGNEDLGRHFEAIGKLNDATEAYSRMRQDVSTTKHIIDCGMHLANVSLYRRDWNMVLTNIGKITGVQSPDEEETLQSFVRLLSGIAHLNIGSYLEAAKNLLLTDFAVPPAQYNHVTSPNDIAIYGGLTALATMDRTELQRRVLDNQSFRTFLEHEPHIRKAVSLFVSGRYSNCLSILESYRSDYLLDVYLRQHVKDLYKRIRTKCIVQYFLPFSRITLESLDAAFGLPGESLEEELMAMIRNDFLNARIDARNKLLVAVQPDPRADMQRQSLKAAKKYERDATEHLRRINIISAGLEVLPGKVEKPGPPDEWFDERANVALMESMETEESTKVQEA
ncbi:COP9 signalosome complex subunit 1 [Beauveria bassiana]|uniref:COP9 signalosome complex subunit 1 n=1 Tax=Beauveria bassiana TaxID=176275 RepID=A0A2N6NY80_BEABA|nr:COP9 signalosome complex subunit 1 [Beauveria bassiana]